MTAHVAVPEVEFAGVSKSYAGRAVLNAVDLRITKGEFVTLIGPSGCGKSTALKLISGLSTASAGAIRVDGMTPQNARPTMSYIFQDATLLPWRTVRQNVGLGLELEGVVTRQREEKTVSAIDAQRAIELMREFDRFSGIAAMAGQRRQCNRAGA